MYDILNLPSFSITTLCALERKHNESLSQSQSMMNEKIHIQYNTAIPTATQNEFIQLIPISLGLPPTYLP
jgi:hypothetical protein